MVQRIHVDGMGEVEFPDGMSDAEIVSAIRRSSQPQPKPINPTDGMSTADKLLSGVGKAFYDVGRGAGALVTDAFPSTAKYGLSTRKDIDEAKKNDAPLMNTGAGFTGNLIGNIAAFAPIAAIPGANTITGGALIVAATGALQPVGTDDSRMMNSTTGGLFGAALPAVVSGAKAAKAALVEPFTSKGQTAIASRVINKAAANPEMLAKKLLETKGATAGFVPTVGQAADDAGVAALERSVRASQPNMFDSVDKSQRGALVDALRNIAKTPEERAAAVKAVEKQAKDLYGRALQENVQVTPQLSRLSTRPSMQKAQARAIALSEELGLPYRARLDDMRPKSIPIDAPTGTPSSVLGDLQTDSLGMIKGQPEKYIPSQPSGGAFFDLPPVESVPVRDMHTLKMGMDALLTDPSMGIAGTEASAIRRTREALLDQLPESYQVARQGHIEINKPVHQMDIGTELYNRFTPALADQGGLPFKSTAQSYANALRNGDDLAKNVTGLKNATLEGIMTPEQLQVLRGVAQDSAMKAAAENAGRGVGSDTFQKLSMSNIASQAGVPEFVSNLARVPAGWIKRVGDAAYGGSDDAIRAKLAELLLDPRMTGEALATGMPSVLGNKLKSAAQGVSLSLPAIFNAQQQ
jgi:hypothetical protein